jgi:hypothetical protein
MSFENEGTKETTPTRERYDVPVEKGYQPERSNLDPSDPPQGGSGVPPKPESQSSQANKDE